MSRFVGHLVHRLLLPNALPVSSWSAIPLGRVPQGRFCLRFSQDEDACVVERVLLPAFRLY